MTSTDSKMDALLRTIAGMKLDQDVDTNLSQASHYYETRQNTKKVNFARLEKGLLLFIYVHETTKNSLHSELALWDHRLCIHVIKDDHCSKPREQCRYEHKTSYRQPNICSFWYTHTCTYEKKCRYAHDFLTISEHHQYILNRTDSRICKLIRFVRNFAGHYIDSAIKDDNDLQELHKEIVILMLHLVHTLSPKRVQSIDHLNLFLEATTIKQLIPSGKLLEELEKPYAVPEVFFESTMNFNTHWYRHGTHRRTIDFSQMSSQLVKYFNSVFIGFYEGRLKSRGAPTAWD
jgi:hypothetical protein